MAAWRAVESAIRPRESALSNQTQTSVFYSQIRYFYVGAVIYTGYAKFSKPRTARGYELVAVVTRSIAENIRKGLYKSHQKKPIQNIYKKK